jgi:hypothetical protein
MEGRRRLMAKHTLITICLYEDLPPCAPADRRMPVSGKKREQKEEMEIADDYYPENIAPPAADIPPKRILSIEKPDYCCIVYSAHLHGH